jgi:hypothetical protein
VRRPNNGPGLAFAGPTDGLGAVERFSRRGPRPRRLKALLAKQVVPLELLRHSEREKLRMKLNSVKL